MTAATRETLELDGVRGLRYADTDDDLLARLPGWMRAGRVDDAEEIRPGRLYRRGAHAIKFFGTRRGWRAKLRTNPAVRAADLAAGLAPIATPQPLLALETTGAGERVRCLVYAWVEGRHLHELWDDDPTAVAAYPEFLAAMHAHGVWHGDLHLLNSVWDGERWVLLDLDGLRHRLRSLLPATLAEVHWSHTVFGLTCHTDASDDELRELFERYVELSGGPRDPAAAWRRIRQREARFHDEWAAIVAAREA